VVGGQRTVASWRRQVECDEDDGEDRVVGRVDVDALVKREQVLVGRDGGVDARVGGSYPFLGQSADEFGDPTDALRWSCRRAIGCGRGKT
jgi:hypothetical protein